MDRTLDHSLIALCAAGFILALGLLATTPASDGADRSNAPVSDSAAALDTDGTDSDIRPRRSAKGARRGLALPYFSFAHGLRRVGG